MNNSGFTDSFCPCHKTYYEHLLSLTGAPGEIKEFEDFITCDGLCKRARNIAIDRMKLEAGVAHSEYKSDHAPEHLLLKVEALSFATTNYRRWRDGAAV